MHSPNGTGDQFPDGFLWAVASAAYQVEGATDRGGRHPSVWDRFSSTSGNVKHNHTGEPACGSYDDPERDAQLIADLGCGGYRFSVSWPRVIPEGTGPANEEGLAYYDRLVDALLDRGVQPWVTLFHWDLPTSLHDRGGWLSPESPGWFERYAKVVVERLGDRVHHWFTFNEPQIFIGHGYLNGVHAPGLSLSRADGLRISRNVLLAHGRGVQAIRAASPKPCKVGWAPVGAVGCPADDRPETLEAARLWTHAVHDDVKHWWAQSALFSDPAILGRWPDGMEAAFGGDMPPIEDADLDTIHQPIDFYGVNIYSAARITAEGKVAERQAGFPETAFGWAVEPDCLYWGPRLIHERYQLPVYITENGLASMDWIHHDGQVHDLGRIDYLCRHLHALRRAIADGVDVGGYFQWSILDNFEWAEGYAKRFGLVYVDYRTGERLPKRSYHWFSEVIRSNGSSIPSRLHPIG
ncbi:MAG: GH1 family beta-glucosidase [Planctomycetota bacterium]